jgi:hypothetical protein
MIIFDFFVNKELPFCLFRLVPCFAPHCTNDTTYTKHITLSTTQHTAQTTPHYTTPHSPHPLHTTAPHSSQLWKPLARRVGHFTISHHTTSYTSHYTTHSIWHHAELEATSSRRWAGRHAHRQKRPELAKFGKVFNSFIILLLSLSIY